MYERETDRHHPPQDMSILGPIVDRLQETPCNWWTIELTDYAEALSTRTLLLDYLANKNQRKRLWSERRTGLPDRSLYQADRQTGRQPRPTKSI